VSSLTLQDTQEVSGFLSGRPNVMDGRSFKLTLEHDPRCGSVELGRFDLVGVGSRAATTRASRLDLQGRQLRFKVSGRLDIPAVIRRVRYFIDNSMCSV
jgi:hypothetical protein